MKDIYSAIGKIALTMFCFGMYSQAILLQAQANAAGPICGKAFVSESGPGMFWSEAANVRCDDNEDRAYTAPLTKGQVTQVLKVSDFGFALPADARVEGIEVVIIRKGDVSDGIVDRSVMLMNGGVAGGSNLRSRDLWEDSWTAAYYGDDHEDWDHPWTVKDVNSAGFGVAISVQGEGVIARPQIDEVLVTVHFSYGAASGRTHKASSSATRNTCNGWGS
jgi:hypothetical protein